MAIMKHVEYGLSCDGCGKELAEYEEWPNKKAAEKHFRKLGLRPTKDGEWFCGECKEESLLPWMKNIKTRKQLDAAFARAELKSFVHK